MDANLKESPAPAGRVTRRIGAGPSAVTSVPPVVRRGCTVASPSRPRSINMGYSLKAYVGVFWVGPTINLGTFRFHWMAWLYAQAYLVFHPYRSVSVCRLVRKEAGA